MPSDVGEGLTVAADALIAAGDVVTGVNTPYGRFCSGKSLPAEMVMVPSHGMPAPAPGRAPLQGRLDRSAGRLSGNPTRFRRSSPVQGELRSAYKATGRQPCEDLSNH